MQAAKAAKAAKDLKEKATKNPKTAEEFELTFGEGHFFDIDAKKAWPLCSECHPKNDLDKGSGKRVCERSLYKRALKQDDPVRHILCTFGLY